MKTLKKKAIGDLENVPTTLFGDLCKKNFHKLLYHLMREDEEHQVKFKVFSLMFSKLQKSLGKLDRKSNPNYNKTLEYVCFTIKTIEDCLKRTSRSQIVALVQSCKAQLIEVICLGSENEEIMVRNQAQQLFTYLTSLIFDNAIPMREELELMMVKVVFKPALQLAKKLESKEKALSKSQSTSQGSSE
jgi:hypothetical protein